MLERFALAASLTALPTLAQTGLTWIPNPATGNQYALTTLMTWDTAHAYAQTLDADLCVVDDAAENAWVAQNFLTFPFFGVYLGGTDAQVEGLWLNPYGFPLGYTNWAPNQPDNSNGGQHRLMMWQGNPQLGVPFATWDDQAGTAPSFAVLERPMPQWVAYGSGCSGSNGVPQLAAAVNSPAPQPGAQVQMALSNLPTTGGFGIGVLSLSSANVPLGPIGLPGCLALVDLQGALTVTLPFAGAATTWLQPLPNLTLIRGLHLHAQVLVLDPNAGNSFGGVTSAGLEIRVGY